MRFASYASVLGSLLLTVPVLAANPYAPNLTASKTDRVSVSGGSGSVGDTSTTGVSVTIAGATGLTDVNVTTQSLNAPSSGFGAFSGSGGAYFGVNLQLPPCTTAPAGATFTICFTDP